MIGTAPFAPSRGSRWPRISPGPRCDAAARAHRTAAQIRGCGDRELLARADTLRELARGGTSPADDAIADDAIALFCEAVRRVKGIAPYDVQIAAARAMLRGAVAEMATGEGKTLSVAIAAFVLSLQGRGVHVASANSYLAGRDADELAPVFALLGGTAAALPEAAQAAGKRQAYEACVTYGPGHEFGFDYLRDRVTERQTRALGLGERYGTILSGRGDPARGLARRLACAVIDEADQVLLDDAASPLVLGRCEAGEPRDAEILRAAARLAADLQSPEDFQIHPQSASVRLTQRGWTTAAETLLAVDQEALQRSWAEYVEQALYARHVLSPDVHYVVHRGRVEIVDLSTGRIFPDRTWSDGVHQAVEALQGLAIRNLQQPVAQITRQCFFGRYPFLAGATGTVRGAEKELRRIYGLAAHRIPRRAGSRLVELPPRYFADAEAQLRAVCAEALAMHHRGRPVLIGTQSIDRSRRCAAMLAHHDVPAEILNGTQDADEALVIAQAGRPSRITVATNLAGRGTDIRVSAEAIRRGGLHVISAGRHPARRTDLQLVGRAGRQGQPGSARFFVSADDLLVSQFDESFARRMRWMAARNGEIARNLDRPLRRIQRRAEREAYQRRLRLWQRTEQDEVMLGAAVYRWPSSAAQTGPRNPSNRGAGKR